MTGRGPWGAGPPDPLGLAVGAYSAAFPPTGCPPCPAAPAASAARRWRWRWGCCAARWRRTNRWSPGPSWPRSASARRRTAPFADGEHPRLPPDAPAE